MQVDRITIALRPRVPREAVDLGARLLRANARAVWSAWFAATLPVFVVLNAACFALGAGWVAALAMWWLKPAFDRIPLYVLSRAVFGTVPDWRETLRGQRAWRWAPTLAHLTWLRLDSTRALRLPLVFLEGVRGAAQRARWRVLRRPLVGDAAFLTYSGVQFELVLYLGVWLGLALMLPRELLPDDWGALRAFLGPTPVLVGASNLLVYLAMSVIEPLYVASGFMLYLNRRTQLECWDLDLAFRRLGARLATVALLVLVGLAASAAPIAARAAEPVPARQVFAPADAATQRRFDAAAEAVAADPLLGRSVHRSTWMPRRAVRVEKSRVAAAPVEGPGLAALGGLLRVLMWGLLACVVAILAVALARGVGRRGPRRPRPAREASAEVDTAPAQAPWPDDLGTAVRGLWQSGRPREALALLYRGTARAVFEAAQVEWPSSATEADCLRHAANLPASAQTTHARHVVRAWQAAAYAGRLPDEAGFEALLQGWPLRPLPEPAP